MCIWQVNIYNYNTWVLLNRGLCWPLKIPHKCLSNCQMPIQVHLKHTGTVTCLFKISYRCAVRLKSGDYQDHVVYIIFTLIFTICSTFLLRFFLYFITYLYLYTCYCSLLLITRTSYGTTFIKGLSKHHICSHKYSMSNISVCNRIMVSKFTVSAVFPSTFAAFSFFPPSSFLYLEVTVTNESLETYCCRKRKNGFHRHTLKRCIAMPAICLGGSC